MNKRRIARKAQKLWNYHFYKKGNYKKAIANYMKYITLIEDNDMIYSQLWYSYNNVWDLNKSLYYTNKWLEYSSWDYNLLKLKWEILADLWREDEAKIYLSKIQDLDEQISEMELDLDKFYLKK